MNKTFKNATNSGTEVYVGEGINTDSVQLIIRNVGSGIGKAGIYLNSSDAPALALAILEAAGYGEEVVTDGSPDGHVRVAKYYLYEGVKAHASITAEAKAQAELEAEALELYQLWETLQSDDETVWLAVARRARELAKEATK